MLKIITDLVTGIFSIPVLFSVMYLITLFKMKPSSSSFDFKKFKFTVDENLKIKEEDKHNKKED